MAKIETIEALREIYRPAAGRAVEKELSALDPHCKRFIELSPFLLLATHNAEGVVDITPRGDEPGFVAVPDSNTIIIPDRPGNNRLRDDADLLAEFEVKKRLPATVLKITVDLAFLHCAKALMRSRLWDPEAQIERSTLPTLGKMIMDQLGLKDDGESQEQMVKRYKEALY